MSDQIQARQVGLKVKMVSDESLAAGERWWRLKEGALMVFVHTARCAHH